MKTAAGLADWLELLVHKSARGDEIERTRHVLFIAIRLALVLAALVSVPPYLVLQGAPNPIDAIVFGWALTPLAAVWMASRTGDLLRAHTVSLVGLIGMAVTLAFGAPGLSIPSTIWLVLAPLDAIFAFSIPLIIGAGASALLAVFAIAGLKAAGIAATGGLVSDTTASIVLSLAVVYVCAMATGAIHLHETRRRSQTIGMARYQTLAGVIGDLVLRLDRSGAVLYSGAASEQIIGRSPRELMGRGLFERVHVADRPAFLKAASDAVDSASAVRVDLRIRVSLSPEDLPTIAPEAPIFRWFELRAHRVAIDDTPLHADDGVHIVAVLRDVTSAKQHESDLEAARLEAESANKWKDRFLANVSHELRTPLNAIIGFSEILGSREMTPTDPAKQIEYARIIHESGHHLLAVVNSILDISKIEAGSFDILPEPFEIQPLIDQVCDMLSLKAEENGVEIVRSYPDRLEELVADKRAFKQVMINLMSNAVKFTPRNGKVNVSVRPEGAAMVFEVSDTGIGIRTLDLSRLGDPFFQARATYDRPYEGTGLGLSVVRGLVGLHGGNIKIESAPSEGTRVTVRLPLDCRTIAKEHRTSAKIEALPLKYNRTGAEPFSSTHDMVKKIA